MEIENPKNDNNDNDNKMDICEDKKQDKEYQPYSLILRIEEPYKDISHNRFNKKYFIFYKFLLQFRELYSKYYSKNSFKKRSRKFLWK